MVWCVGISDLRKAQTKAGSTRNSGFKLRPLVRVNEAVSSWPCPTTELNKLTHVMFVTGESGGFLVVIVAVELPRKPWQLVGGYKLGPQVAMRLSSSGICLVLVDLPNLKRVNTQQ